MDIICFPFERVIEINTLILKTKTAKPRSSLAPYPLVFLVNLKFQNALHRITI
jgi:hypothetical protein